MTIEIFLNGDEKMSEKKKRSFAGAKAPQAENYRWDESKKVNFYDLRGKKYNAEYQTVRLVGEPFPFATTWISGVNKSGKEYSFSVPCFSYNPDTMSYEDSKYDPYLRHKEKLEQKGFSIRTSVAWASNAIIRSIETKTPDDCVRQISFPNTCALTLQKIEKKKACESTDPKKGFDVNISYDANASGSDKWNVQKDENSVVNLKELQDSLVVFDDVIPCFLNSKDDDGIFADYKKQIEDDVRKKLEGGKKGPAEEIDDADLDDEDAVISKSKKSAKKPVDEDDDEIPVKAKKASKTFSDDDDEDDEKPVRKAAKAAKVEEDDEDDEPVTKPKKAKPVTEDDEDDEDDEPAPKSKKSKPVDEDDEEEPAPKAKKSRNDDEDDDEEDAGRKPAKKRVDTDDEDEDEAPKKSTKKGLKKLASVDDEDDE